MDQPSGRSFMQVLCEKYSPENFPYRRGPGMGVHVPATPQGSPMKDRLNLPSVLVLNSCGITCAGDEKEIAAFCAHVSELDLSDNRLEDWHEVSKIVSNVPQLEFLNLSSNPLNLSVLERRCAGSFSGVRKLVLNNSKASWETVHTILQELPDLEELFLCLNDYETVSCPSICCPSLKLLHITDNNLQDWTEIRKLGVMFPSLDTLVLANNHVNAIEEPGDSLARLFPNLRSISLHKAGLRSWEDIDKLNSFPKLEEVRLLGIPLLQPYTTEERRKLVIARLPSVSKLNGSVVTDGEREDSERFFIRYFVDVPQEEVPFRRNFRPTRCKLGLNGSSLYLDTTSMKAYFVLDAGEILVCCVRYLIFLPDRGPAVVKEHSYIGHESPGVLHTARLHHPLTRAVTQHPSHSAASLMRNKRGFLLGTPWTASEMLALPLAYSFCHSNYLGLDCDFFPLSQPSRR
ncbi:tubulin-specific chaperone cofactor E-like protein isoform X1 [Delphinapterus leucas]|uniref:Tubulin-specific chaperone cofactor E-like protein isoform X1 n=1 Tax=Delphinapterus leucas TaxID=9749 RepID=A0A2Y9M2N6_DELLE|nr:tubulin-specific chaperone cofactor E-like protein isoform X1 [Delphinapterus leucas]XP_022415975.1 tubulin-specific chaperone cofactor E-like protein isoform X1 [Delphinapterus leucas]